jgi:hypothetical protein
MPTWFKVILLIVPLYSAAAALSEWLYHDPRPPGRIATPLLRPFKWQAGFAFTATFFPDQTEILTFADDTASAPTSALRIYENGKPLALPRSNYGDISRIGNGHFAFWKDQGLIFSTSDNSDPNANGRQYWAVIP